jgi:hypothetical protein
MQRKRKRSASAVQRTRERRARGSDALRARRSDRETLHCVLREGAGREGLGALVAAWKDFLEEEEAL